MTDAIPRLDKLRAVIREAFNYFDKSHDGTVFNEEVGTIMRYLGQFPGEEEVLMPPLSNLEVMGEPYLTRLEGHIVLIVPLRVNVNIKSKTMDELTSTRKDVLLSAIKDLHAEITSKATRIHRLQQANEAQTEAAVAMRQAEIRRVEGLESALQTCVANASC